MCNVWYMWGRSSNQHDRLSCECKLEASLPTTSLKVTDPVSSSYMDSKVRRSSAITCEITIIRLQYQYKSLHNAVSLPSLSTNMQRTDTCSKPYRERHDPTLHRFLCMRTHNGWSCLLDSDNLRMLRLQQLLRFHKRFVDGRVRSTWCCVSSWLRKWFLRSLFQPH